MIGLMCLLLLLQGGTDDEDEQEAAASPSKKKAELKWNSKAAKGVKVSIFLK